ncbi:DUF551 domain-containing protein [Escherichia coli]|nr:DUF551 domain-containing protein [Escherichia coli]EGS5911554.1 DUF551 domain-containing protein [Escherichia coli]
MITITKERLLTIKQWRETYGPGSNVVLPAEEAEELARIALASLEAEPVAYIFKHPAGKLFWALTDESNKEQPDVIPVYADSPAPVVPEEATPENVEMLSGYVSTYKLTDSERDIAAEIWNACRTAMLQSGNFRESKNSSTNNFRKIPEASTSSPVTPALLPGGFTIEEAKELHEDLVRSHISKALSGEKMKKKDRDADLRWIHGVIVQAAWFVKASLEQNALSGNSPGTPDGWISCSEQMPNTKTAVLVAVEFDRKGDWRMKWATYIPGHPDANDGWIIPGASWKPSHWMPLPEPPQEVNRG